MISNFAKKVVIWPRKSALPEAGMFRRGYLPAILLFSTAVFAGSVFASEKKSEQQIVIDLDACINTLLNKEKTVYQGNPLTLKQDCPKLLPYLTDPLFEHISPPLEDKTTFSQLYDVLRILKSARVNKHVTNWQFDHAGLSKLLDEVYEPIAKPEEINNFVDVFWKWIEQKLREYLGEDNWFTRTFDFDIEPGDDLFSGLKNLLIAMLVVMILYIIINELYAANIRQYFSRRKAAKTSVQKQLERHNKAPTGLNDIIQLPLRQQVPALLRYSLQVLIKKGVIPNRYSLTNQEFLKITKKHAPEISRDLGMIITSSDKVLYGNKSISAGDASLLFEYAKKLESAHIKDRT